MNLAPYIDHTILKAQATLADIKKLCLEAKEHDFAAVCVNPCFVKAASVFLESSTVKLATVVGFPLGASATPTKVFETQEAIKNGATEIDMVMAIGLFKSGDHKYVKDDIKAVVEAAGTKAVKVIIETCYLSTQEIARAAQLAVDAGAAFVKTSTGFGSRGASLEDILIIKRAIADKARIKASGGIRNREDALAMIEAGASRIGTSSGIAIVSGG
jgi:deoxyribose-phosphate aldolase